MDEELKKKMDKEYDKHTKRDDGRCQGYHSANENTGVYEYLLERDFLDEVIWGDMFEV